MRNIAILGAQGVFGDGGGCFAHRPLSFNPDLNLVSVCMCVCACMCIYVRICVQMEARDLFWMSSSIASPPNCQDSLSLTLEFTGQTEL